MKVHFHSPVTFEGTGLKAKLAEVRQGYRDAKAVDQHEDQLLGRFEAANTLVRTDRNEHTLAVWNEISSEIAQYILGGTASKSFVKALNKASEENVKLAMENLKESFPGSTIVVEEQPAY